MSESLSEAGGFYQQLRTEAGGDPDAIRERILDRLRQAYPGITFVPGDLSWLEADGVAEEASFQEQLLIGRADDFFVELAEQWDGILRNRATTATAHVTFTRDDDDGELVLEAPVQLKIGGQGFLTTVDATFEDGEDAVSGVTIAAAIVGSQATGLSGPVQILDALAGITATLDEDETVNGRDEESLADFRDRVTRLKRIGGRPTQDDDYAAHALNHPAVARVLVKNLYNPADPDDEEAGEGWVWLAVVDANGNDLSGDDMDAIEADLQANVLPGINTPVNGATRTPVFAHAIFSVLPGYTYLEVAPRVRAAMGVKLSKSTYGNPGALRYVTWIETPVIRPFEIGSAVDQVQGVDQVDGILLSRGRAVTGLASSNVITAVGHGFVDTDEITFRGLVGGAPLVDDTTYFVRDETADAFKVALTSGGTAIDITADITVGWALQLESANLTIPGPAALPELPDGSITTQELT